MVPMLTGLLQRLGMMSTDVSDGLDDEEYRRGRAPSLRPRGAARVSWKVPDGFTPGAGHQVVISGTEEIYEVVPRSVRERVTVGVTPELRDALRERLRLRLADLEPGTAFVLDSHTSDVEAALLDGRLDMALGVTAPEEPLRGHPVCFDRYVCVLREGHPALDGEAMTRDAYINAAHMRVSKGQGVGSPLDKRLASVGLEPRFRVPIRPGVDARFMLTQADVVATVPSMVAMGMVRDGGLVQAELPDKSLQCTIYMRWAGALQSDRAHMRLREVVNDSMNLSL